MSHPQPWKALRLAGVALAVGAVALAGCSQPAQTSSNAPAGKDYSDALLTLPREDMGTFTRNFNPFSPNVAPSHPMSHR